MTRYAEGIEHPNFERLNYWGKAVQMVNNAYLNAIKEQPDKKRKYPKTTKEHVYLAALLSTPVYAADVRLDGWPISAEADRVLAVRVLEGYRETVGLIKANADFPAYSIAVFDVRHLVAPFEPMMRQLVEGETTIEAILAWVGENTNKE